MKCELCSDTEATVQVTQVVNGAVKKWNLCDSCASQEGFNIQGPISFTDILFGMGDGAPEPSTQEPKSCPSCHMQRSDFKKNSRLGCPECYETFAFELRPLIEAMHKGSQHEGKIPQNAKISADIARLQAQLDKAVSEQHFEEAARLRDEINSCKARHSAESDQP
jgi:protein arginine kinase activator